MMKCLKTMFYTVIAISFASPLQAKVIHLHDMQNTKFMSSGSFGKGITDGSVAYCDPGKKQYNKKPEGKMCKTTTLKGGTICLVNCVCNKNIYPYSEEECKGEGFKILSSNKTCTNDTDNKTKYSACGCADNFMNIEGVAKYMAYFNVEDGRKVIGSGKLTCFNPSKFKCKAGYKSVSASEIKSQNFSSGSITGTITMKNEPAVIYEAARLDDKICIIGWKGFNEGVMTSAPTDKKCAEYETKTTKYFDKTYYYYTGCKTTGICAENTYPCVKKKTESFSVYNSTTGTTTNKTCTYTSGCNIGVKQGFLCDTKKKVASGLIANSVSDECMIVECASGYDMKVKTEASDTTSINTAFNEIPSWFIKAKHITDKNDRNKYGYMFCRKPNCPANSTYDTSTETCKCNSTYVMNNSICIKDKCSNYGVSDTKIQGYNCNSVSYNGLTCYSCKKPQCKEQGYTYNKKTYPTSSCKYGSDTCPQDNTYFKCKSCKDAYGYTGVGTTSRSVDVFNSLDYGETFELTIEVKNKCTEEVKTVSTDTDNFRNFHLPELTAGTYSMKVTARIKKPASGPHCYTCWPNLSIKYGSQWKNQDEYFDYKISGGYSAEELSIFVRKNYCSTYEYVSCSF